MTVADDGRSVWCGTAERTITVWRTTQPKQQQHHQTPQQSAVGGEHMRVLHALTDRLLHLSSSVGQQQAMLDQVRAVAVAAVVLCCVHLYGHLCNFVSVVILAHSLTLKHPYAQPLHAHTMYPHTMYTHMHIMYSV